MGQGDSPASDETRLCGPARLSQQVHLHVTLPAATGMCQLSIIICAALKKYLESAVEGHAKNPPQQSSTARVMVEEMIALCYKIYV